MSTHYINGIVWRESRLTASVVRAADSFVLAHLVQLTLAIDAIVHKNTIQVVRTCLYGTGRTSRANLLLSCRTQLALVVFNTLFLVYSVIQVS